MRRVLPWAAAVWAATALYALLLSATMLADHEGFRTGFDTAIPDQLVWLLANGHEPFSSIQSRRMLGDHFQPGLALLTPLYWAGLGVPSLLIAETVALALVAPALYALARSAGASPGLASIPAILWLLSPAVVAANLFDFRVAAFAPVLLVLSVLAGLRDRPLLLALTTLVALSLKEDVAPAYVVLGLLLAYHGRRRLGAVLAVGAAAWAAVAFAALSALGEADEFHAQRFAGDRGDGIGDALLYVLRNPLETAGDILGHSGPDLLVLLFTTGGLALLAPSWILLGLPTAAFNALSDYELQHTLTHHYHLPVVTALFVAAALGVPRVAGLGRVARSAFVGVIALALAFGVVEDVRRLDVEGRLDAAEQAEIERALELIPDDAPVAAAPQLLPHLTHRREIYSFPEPFVRIDWGGVLSEEELAERARRVRFVALTGDVKPIEYEGELGPIVERLLEEDFVVVARSQVRNLLVLERR